PPFGNLISLTVPPSSVETTAPTTAGIDPTDERTGGQSSSLTGALDTVVGGIVIGEEAILRNLKAFTSASVKNKARIAKTAPAVGAFSLKNTIAAIANNTTNIVMIRTAIVILQPAPSCLSKARAINVAPLPVARYAFPPPSSLGVAKHLASTSCG